MPARALYRREKNVLPGGHTSSYIMKTQMTCHKSALKIRQLQSCSGKNCPLLENGVLKIGHSVPAAIDENADNDESEGELYQHGTDLSDEGEESGLERTFE